MRHLSAAAAFVAAALVSSPLLAQEGEDPSFLTISAGAFDINDTSDSAEFGLQYRHDEKLWIFKPHAGLTTNSDGAIYGYGGVLVDVYFGKKLVVTPTFAAGYYHEGDSKDLGYALEFRSGIEVAYRFDNRMRLGAGFYHMSNAHLGSDNPGTEELTVNLSVPTNMLLGR